MYGAIEAGGTKFVCAIASSPVDILEKVSFPTAQPLETMSRVADFYHSHKDKYGRLDSLVIGSFGPVGVDDRANNYGVIGKTTKAGWSGFNIYEAIKKIVNTRVIVDTDVNCALVGEAHHGAGKNIDHLVYITFGTGIGGGVLIDGKILQGFSHPELGHMFTPKHKNDENFAGICAFHGDHCFEGLASGPAITARWGQDAATLPDIHPAWELQSFYIASLCASLIQVLTPQKIILGGGVMKQSHLFPKIRKALTELLAGYTCLEDNDIDVNDLIVPVGLAGDAALVGCVIKAQLHLKADNCARAYNTD